MLYGYIGKLLFVDLSNQSYEIRDLDPQMARDFIGGPGLGARILYDEMPPHTPPFAAESMIGFVSGVTNSTAALFGGRYTVVSKSPVYDGWNDANSGGAFGPTMRKSGFDAIFVKGISEKPVYVFVDDGKVEFRDAAHLWGKCVMETEELLREEIGDKKINAALIGPGGENMSYMAAVMNDEHRAAGRGGSGAIMGSKKLKAVVVRGTHKVPVYDSKKVAELNKIGLGMMRGPFSAQTTSLGQLGTGNDYVGGYYNGDLVHKNFTSAGIVEGTMDEVTPFNSGSMDNLYRIKKYSCHSCPLGCGAIYDVKSKKYNIGHTGRPEMETLGGFGSECGNKDVEAMMVCNHLCNEYGLDTISVGGTVAWVIECFSEGELTSEQLDGIKPYWGNPDAMVEICRKICTGEGCGEILKLGSQKAAEIFGVGQDRLVVASGIEAPQHDARFCTLIARTFQYDPAPGRHVQPGIGPACSFDPPEVKFDYKWNGFRDVIASVQRQNVQSMGLCIFEMFAYGFDAKLKIELINAITNFGYTRSDYHNLGMRTFTLRTSFNIREGKHRKDYSISPRMTGHPPLTAGPLAGVTLDNEAMADSFFIAMGYTKDGVPTWDALELMEGLDFIIKDFYPNGPVFATPK